GIPARVVSARAQDVETRRFGAGHVFAEAYLRDQKKWVFLDPQVNVVGEVNGKPLNTVEFRQTFSEPNPKVHYNLLLGSCFYYFSYELDWGYPLGERKPGNILLAPKGAPYPRVFQRVSPRSEMLTTHNPADVYGPPPEVN
ncbi:MAG: transglutaminase domain-containing protein, partial [Akkermansiaceae bacterium]|nr:transglutaminase domain-containing protein [Armatimonadota bacterium]